MAGESLDGGPEKPSSKVVKVKPGLLWRPQDAAGASTMIHFKGEVEMGCGTSPRERSVL